MLRQALIYLILSLLVVIFANYAHLAIVYIDTLFTYVNIQLAPFFNNTGWGLMIRKILVLVLLPIAITSVPAIFYKIIKRKPMPHFISITWMIWIIIVLSDILIR